MVEGKQIFKCSSETCSAHQYVEEAVRALEGIAEKLSEGQTEIRIHLAKLSENMESVARLHKRIDSLEAKVEHQGVFMYKLLGGAIVLSVLLPPIIEHWLK